MKVGAAARGGLLVWAALCAAQAAAAAAGVVAGVVRDEGTGRPVSGARIEVEAGARSCASGADGRFVLGDVAPGVIRLTVAAEGYLPQQFPDVVVTAGRETALDVRLSGVPTQREEVLVRASAFVRTEDAPLGAIGMSYDEIRRAAGAFGGDVGRLVQALPGLAARDDLRNDVVARGGSPAENLFLVDGIEVPSLSHFGAQGASGGPISMLSAEVVNDARFLAGGFPVRYGDRLSSVLEVFLREGSRQHIQAEVDVGTAGAGVIAEGPLPGSGSWLLCGRRSYVDLVAGAVDASAVPTYGNYLLKANYDLGAATTLSLVSLGGREDLAVDVSQQDADDPNTVDTDQRGWRATTGLRVQRLLGGHGAAALTLAHTRMAFDTDAWDRALDGALVLHNRSREDESSARLDISSRSGALGTIVFGASSKRLAATIERSQPLGEEDPLSPDPTRVNAYAIRDRRAVWQSAGHLQITRPVVSRTSLTLGGRLERFEAARAWRVSPRGSVSLRATSALELSLAAGRYFQMPALVFLGAHAENARLLPMRADHVTAGVAWTLRADLRLSVEAYRKRYASYPVARDFPSISLANLGDAYDTSLFLAPMLSRGTGRARGLELLVQKKLGGRVYGQASYAWSRSEYRAIDGVWRPGGYDLPHVGTLVGGIRLTPRLELAARASYTSGRPVTPLNEAASVLQNRKVLDAARVNGARAPEYFRLDLRADRRFGFGWGNLVLYLELENVLDRENVRGFVWNEHERKLEAEPQAGRLVIGGLNLEL